MNLQYPILLVVCVLRGLSFLGCGGCCLRDSKTASRVPCTLMAEDAMLTSDPDPDQIGITVYSGNPADHLVCTELCNKNENSLPSLTTAYRV